MLASSVLVKDMKTANDCFEAIAAIENDERNSNGDWYSGNETTLKAGAKKKIEALTRKLYSFPDE